MTDGPPPDERFAAIYDELRAMAAAALRRERSDFTLQATALVNEAFFKIAGSEKLSDLETTHFKAISARALKQALIDHVRVRGSKKRDPGRQRVPIEEAATGLALDQVEFNALHDALERLKALDHQAEQVVLLRFFGGLTHPEIAQILEISLSTVEARWRFARAWLRCELAE